eukprot:TRINITY_DN1716_c0_g1_i1.p1 TRINITY_DN1716_c0_g1~~TRINITY_DN1716_c0_g1_i1.p1  ORF type:complete len:220 (+),score=-28.11 TRINITY_DN1716_c0_g1_i1:484-1143(+)
MTIFASTKSYPNIYNYDIIVAQQQYLLLLNHTPISIITILLQLNNNICFYQIIQLRYQPNKQYNVRYYCRQMATLASIKYLQLHYYYIIQQCDKIAILWQLINNTIQVQFISSTILQAVICILHTYYSRQMTTFTPIKYLQLQHYCIIFQYLQLRYYCSLQIIRFCTRSILMTLFVTTKSQLSIYNYTYQQTLEKNPKKKRAQHLFTQLLKMLLISNLP